MTSKPCSTCQIRWGCYWFQGKESTEKHWQDRLLSQKPHAFLVQGSSQPQPALQPEYQQWLLIPSFSCWWTKVTITTGLDQTWSKRPGAENNAGWNVYCQGLKSLCHLLRRNSLCFPFLGHIWGVRGPSKDDCKSEAEKEAHREGCSLNTSWDLTFTDMY